MHKRLINECLIDLKIEAEGPLLVKSGAPGIGSSVDMTPVVTLRGGSPEAYLPGSSLKGALRSHAERIARTLCYDPDQWKLGACDPFSRAWENPEGSCSEKLQCRQEQFGNLSTQDRERYPDDKVAPSVAYRDSCPICKLYGNTSLLGRFSIGDGYLVDGSVYRAERRDMVAINRLTGGVAQGPFDMEVVTRGAFEARVKLTNFELWQLGLVALVLRDLCQGLIALGMGKSRGLGQVSATISQVRIGQVSRPLPPDNAGRIYGLFALESPKDQQAYGYWREEATGVPLVGHAVEEDPLGLRTIYTLQEETAIYGLWSQVAQLVASMLDSYEVPQGMRAAHLRELRQRAEANHAG